jgi:predicted XRE-type DNA-binding protein
VLHEEGQLDPIQWERLSGSRFLELRGYLKLRADLMLNVQKVITARGLKPAEVAGLLGVTQRRVSDLMHGRIDLFTIDTLIEMLARLGVRTRLLVESRRRRAGAA